MDDSNDILDLIIVGAGPAGISAADVAAREGLSYVVFEKALIANTVYNYPVGRTVFSTVDELELQPGELRPAREKPTREELLSHYVQYVVNEDLKIRTEEEVFNVKKVSENRFDVVTNHGNYSARRILFTIGAMARAKELGIKGEHLPKVKHRFVDPFPYVRKNVMVVGGGNSAAEAALFLAEEGAHVTFSIWKSDWENRDPKKGCIKHWVRTPIEEQIAKGRLRVQLFSEISAVTENSVVLLSDTGERLELPNDTVFILIGAEADLRLLEQLGIEIVQAGFNRVPIYDPETFETAVKGVYVAGHFTYARHIKDAIAVPRRIVPAIAADIRATRHDDLITTGTTSADDGGGSLIPQIKTT